MSFTTIIKKTHFPESSEIEVVAKDGTRIIFYAYEDSNNLPLFSPTPSAIEQFSNMYDHGCKYYIKETVTSKSKLLLLLNKDEFRKKYKIFEPHILRLILQFI